MSPPAAIRKPRCSLLFPSARSCRSSLMPVAEPRKISTCSVPHATGDVHVSVAVFVDVAGSDHRLADSAVGRWPIAPIGLTGKRTVGALKEPQGPAPKAPAVELKGSEMMCSLNPSPFRSPTQAMLKPNNFPERWRLRCGQPCRCSPMTNQRSTRLMNRSSVYCNLRCCQR